MKSNTCSNKHKKDIRKMFNYHSVIISEIILVNNDIQYNCEISKTLTRIKEYFHRIPTIVLS